MKGQMPTDNVDCRISVERVDIVCVYVDFPRKPYFSVFFVLKGHIFRYIVCDF